MLAIPAFAHLPGYLDLIIIRPAAWVKDLHDRSEIIVPGWLLQNPYRPAATPFADIDAAWTRRESAVKIKARV